jgi:eukaryotic-like serine/threonine-protein kinase
LPLIIGDKIGRYTITKLINEGMANSYFVKANSSTYFLKEYSDPRVSDPLFAKFFDNQRILIELLNSMGSVSEKFIDHFVENGNYYQIKVKLPGINLNKWLLDNSDFNKRKMMSLLLCGVVKYLHSFKIVHQDLKPDQVMLVDDIIGKKTKLGYRIVLSDFDWSIPNRVSVKIVGTALYKSPEHYLGIQPIEKSDIFTVGIMIFELLTGQNPYYFGTAETEKVIKERVLNKKIFKSPIELNPEISNELNTLLLETLEVKPENRPSIEDLQLALSDRKDTFSQFMLKSAGKSIIIYQSKEFDRKTIKDFLVI